MSIIDVTYGLIVVAGALFLLYRFVAGFGWLPSDRVLRRIGRRR